MGRQPPSLQSAPTFASACLRPILPLQAGSLMSWTEAEEGGGLASASVHFIVQMHPSAAAPGCGPRSGQYGGLKAADRLGSSQ